MSSANGLVGTGFNPEWVFKDLMGRCMATTPSSLSLTTNHLFYTDNPLDNWSVCP